MNKPDFINILDGQIHRYAPHLCEKIGLELAETSEVASTIWRELCGARNLVAALGTKDPVPVLDRLIRFQAFFAWNATLEDSLKAVPDKYRAHVRGTATVMHAYHCFVYLKDGLFMPMRDKLPKPSLSRKCAVFLLRPEICAFRNAFAHGNWTVLPGNSIRYWARSNPEDTALHEWTVELPEFEFWLVLSRAVGLAALDAVSRTQE